MFAKYSQMLTIICQINTNNLKYLPNTNNHKNCQIFTPTQGAEDPWHWLDPGHGEEHLHQEELGGGRQDHRHHARLLPGKTLL